VEVSPRVAGTKRRGLEVSPNLPQTKKNIVELTGGFTHGYPYFALPDSVIPARPSLSGWQAGPTELKTPGENNKVQGRSPVFFVESRFLLKSEGRSPEIFILQSLVSGKKYSIHLQSGNVNAYTNVSPR
jgi:hypothetical protein